MPNTREKLIDLITERENDLVRKIAWFTDTYRIKEVADHLIANGVTFATDNNVGDKLAPTEPLTNCQQWIPVTERLPEKDGQYLVYERGYIIPSIRVLSFANDGRKVDKYDFCREWRNVWYQYDSEWGHITIDDVTHWMPLPEPPKGE